MRIFKITILLVLHIQVSAQTFHSNTKESRSMGIIVSSEETIDKCQSFKSSSKICLASRVESNPSEFAENNLENKGFFQTHRRTVKRYRKKIKNF
jgi:hypothetical protein